MPNRKIRRLAESVEPLDDNDEFNDSYDDVIEQWASLLNDHGDRPESMRVGEDLFQLDDYKLVWNGHAFVNPDYHDDIMIIWDENYDAWDVVYPT